MLTVDDSVLAYVNGGAKDTDSKSLLISPNLGFIYSHYVHVIVSAHKSA